MSDDENERWSQWYKPRNPFLESATTRSSSPTVQSNPTLFKSSQNSIKVVDPSKLSPDPTIPRGSEKAEFGNVCKGLRECADEVNDDQNATTTRLSYPICKEEQMGFVS